MKILISRENLEEFCRDAFVAGYASADGYGTAPWETSETMADLHQFIANQPTLAGIATPKPEGEK